MSILGGRVTVGGGARVGALGAVLLAIAACGGGASPTPAATPTAAATPAATAAHAATAAPTGTAAAAPGSGGPASLDAAAQVAAGARFEVAWTGPSGQGDYVTIVARGAERWTNESYFDTSTGSPGSLVAPTTAGDYELGYVVGADRSVAARRPIAVLAFAGSVSGPPTVTAGSRFEVTWTGPSGPGDYVTIVAKGAQRWTNESYADTSTGSPAVLVAPIEAGDYELWYVTGADARAMVRSPITVQPFSITLKAPAAVDHGATFEVAWTGPDGPSDYITIAPAGSPDGTYLSYANTSTGSPVTLTAPDQPGAYEIRYASDRVPGTFARVPIVVR